MVVILMVDIEYNPVGMNGVRYRIEDAVERSSWIQKSCKFIKMFIFQSHDHSTSRIEFKILKPRAIHPFENQETNHPPIPQRVENSEKIGRALLT